MVADVARGGSPRPIKDYLTDSPQGVNWIKIGDTEKGGKYINSTKEKIKTSGVSRSRLIHKGDFLLTNSMSFGRPYISNIEGCIHDGWLVISAARGTYSQDFLFYLLSSRFAYDQFCGKVSGAVVQNLNSDKVADAIFPIPPIEEQQRIVSRLESVMPHLEKYDKAQEIQELLNASINSKLRKSILQDAIRGKLVAQSSDDVPASTLLEQIKLEKQRLLKLGLIKNKDVIDSVIFKGEDNKYYEKVGGKTLDISEEIPFDIPDTWCWARIKTLYQTTSGGTPEKGHPEYYGGGIPWVKVGDLTSLYLYRASEAISKLGLENSSAKVFPIGTILVAMYCNDAIGKSTILASPMATNQAICGLLPNELLYKEYVYYAIQSNKGRLQEQAAGGAQKNINQKIVNELLLPIPPLAEQKRIVQRINDLYAHL